MKLLTLVITLIIGINCNAQIAGKQNPIMKEIMESQFRSDLYSDLPIEGEYFLQKQWESGKLFTKNKKEVSDNFLFRYFVYSQQIHAITNKKDTIALKSDLIDSIFINKQKFIYLTYVLNKSHKNSFFEELTKGKISLLKKYRCMFIQGNVNSAHGYEEIKPDTYVIMKDFYYQKENQPAVSLPTKKSELLQIFTEQKNDIAKFIKSNKLKVKKEKDLIRLFNYYNSLE